MTSETDVVLRTAFLAAFILAYALSSLFYLKKETLQSWSLGFWLGAIAVILLAPVLMGFVAATLSGVV